MRRLIPLLLVLALVPSYAGIDRLPLLPRTTQVRAARYVPEGGWPRRIGRLVPVGGLSLTGDDPAFGGFSALAIQHGAATLLTDGGNYVRIAIRDGRLRTLAAGALRFGPGDGWAKESRDSESLVLDPATDSAWVAFESESTAVWRYTADFTRVRSHALPAAMQAWPPNGGAEAMTRLGRRFVLVSESARWRGRANTREGLLFDGDPAAPGAPAASFGLAVPAGYSASDAAMLPGGDLLLLVRRFERLHFTARLLRYPAAAIRPGALARGTVIAAFAPPLLGENAEGLAVTREGGRTMIWIVTDNDAWAWRPTLLLKFRLLEP